MRKNLTISLSSDDWQKIRTIAESLDETYSRVFHHLIELGTGVVSDDKRVARYRAVLSPHKKFLAKRAQAFSRVTKSKQAT